MQCQLFGRGGLNFLNPSSCFSSTGINKAKRNTFSEKVQNSNYSTHLTTQSSPSTRLQQAVLTMDQNIIRCLVDVWLDKD